MKYVIQTFGNFDRTKKLGLMETKLKYLAFDLITNDYPRLSQRSRLVETYASITGTPTDWYFGLFGTRLIFLRDRYFKKSTSFFSVTYRNGRFYGSKLNDLNQYNPNFTLKLFEHFKIDWAVSFFKKYHEYYCIRYFLYKKSILSRIISGRIKGEKQLFRAVIKYVLRTDKISWRLFRRLCIELSGLTTSFGQAILDYSDNPSETFIRLLKMNNSSTGGTKFEEYEEALNSLIGVSSILGVKFKAIWSKKRMVREYNKLHSQIVTEFVKQLDATPLYDLSGIEIPKYLTLLNSERDIFDKLLHINRSSIYYKDRKNTLFFYIEATNCGCTDSAIICYNDTPTPFDGENYQIINGPNIDKLNLSKIEKIARTSLYFMKNIYLAIFNNEEPENSQ